MKMADFKILSQKEQLTKLNKHLLMLQQMEGRLEDNFKTGEFNFSYSLLKKNAKDLGITVDGKNYVAYAIGDVPPQQTIVKAQQDAVKTKQSNVKSENVVKQQQEIVSDSELKLTTEEVLFVKALFANKQSIVNVQQPQPLFLPQFTGPKKTTGISVYVSQWEAWNQFKEKYSMYSGTDLLALAIEEFMAKYSGD